MSSLLTAAAIDVTHHLIPDECNGIIVLCGLLLSLDKNTLESSVLGMIVGYSLIFIVAIVYQKIRGKEGIGLGDAKLLAGLGAWLGIECIPTLLLGASSLGILYTIALNKGFSRYIAFGPCLIFSSIMMFYW
ncbi:prepilin peptidase [Marinomonas profundi]|nr:A24 family peptidase [Marinomonas profundi]